MGSSQGSNPGPLHWEHGVLATGPPGKSHNQNFDKGLKLTFRDFPGGAVVGNPPANAGDTGPSPGPGRSHMLQSN